MKKIILALLPIFAIVSCGDPALDADYGDTLIYMPQAAHNIGVDNNLTLSISAAAVAEDPERMTETTIGVYRSGTADKKAFSVDLVVAKDTLAMAQAIAAEPDAPEKYSIYKTGVLLDEEYYEPLPAQISVPDGQRQAMTKLILHDAELVSDYAVGQILLLPLRIENPTKYTLNTSLSMTMVVITINE